MKGVDIMNFSNNILISKIIYTILTIIISITIYMLITRVFIKKLENKKSISNKHTKTFIKLLKNVIRYTIIIITILLLLEIYGFNVSRLFASVGIISIIIGFAIQDALKDIIKGIDIMTDNYYRVGDVIKFKDITGKVLSIGLKTTKIEDIYTFNVVSISNRNIELVEVVSNLINIDIPLPYDLKYKNALKVLNIIVNKLSNDKNILKAEYRGVNDFADSSIKYQIKVYTDPIKKVQVRRDVLTCIISTLEDNNIQIPFNQLDIHNK